MLLFGILVFIAAIVLGLIILIQNPKGGGLSGSLAGFSNQIMGVKQTTDVLEKGTWIFAALVGILCMLSPLFTKTSGGSNTNDKFRQQINTQKTAPATAPTTTPQTNGTMPGAAADTSKK